MRLRPSRSDHGAPGARQHDQGEHHDHQFADTAGPAGDPRVTRARQLLGEHHQPIAMTNGELRTLLARYQRRVHELVEVIDGPAVLAPGDLGTVRHALDDAIEYRRENEDGHCADWMETRPCDEHAADARLAIAYSELPLRLEPGCRPARAPVTGPYETAAELRALPAVREIYEAMHVSARRGVMAERNHRLLDKACSAGIELGAHDHRILQWLSGWEPETCAVVCEPDHPRLAWCSGGGSPLKENRCENPQEGR